MSDQSWAKKDLKLGIIGTDTSHAPAFTKLFNSREDWRARVVAAFPGGSPDIKGSANRVDSIAAKVQEEPGVELVGDIDTLIESCDTVLLLSVDGRKHLPQVKKVFEAGKRVFVDKPFSASLEDAREILRLSKVYDVPFFSCSCVRFQPEVFELREDAKVGEVQKVQGCSRMNLEPHHPDLFWYGIHGVEAFYTVLGRGCVSVKRPVVAPDEIDYTTGTWSDGRQGIYRGVRDKSYKPIVKVWGSEGEHETTADYDYSGMVERIAKFFQSGEVPINPKETLEIVEYMTAAQVSKERDGAEVTLEEIRASADTK